MPNSTILASTPAMEPPPGESSNLVDPPNPLFAVSIMTWTICTLAVVISICIQLFTKSQIMKKLEYTDCLPVIAAIGNFSFMALSITTVMHGSGRHQWNVSLADIIYISYWTMIQSAIYFAAVVFSKACVIVPLIKIFAPMKRGPFYWGLWGLLAVITLFYMAGIPIILCACNPRERIWNPFITEGSCVNVVALWLVSSIFNTIADVFIIILPLFNIWHLHISFKHKLGTSVIFTMTLFALASSIARLYYTVLVLHEEDLTYQEHPVGLWATAEMVTLISCSCMPIMPRFYRWCTGKEKKTGSSGKAVILSFHRKTTKQGFTRTGNGTDWDETQELRSVDHSNTDYKQWGHFVRSDSSHSPVE